MVDAPSPTQEHRAQNLEQAERAFIAKYDELSPHLDGFFFFCANHKLYWTFGNWSDELEALRTAVEAQASQGAREDGSSPLNNEPSNV